MKCGAPSGTHSGGGGGETAAGGRGGATTILGIRPADRVSRPVMGAISRGRGGLDGCGEWGGNDDTWIGANGVSRPV